MPESNTPKQTTKDELVAGLKQVLADAQALLHATADQAGEKLASVRTRLQENLQTASGQLAEFETLLVSKTTETSRDALQKMADATKLAAEAASEAAQKAEESVKKATESGKEATQHAATAARDAAQKAVAATQEAADKALAAVRHWMQ